MDAERREITRRVMKAMRYESGRRPLVRGQDGTLPLVICLASDTIGTTAGRVRRAGGIATVVIPDEQHNTLVPMEWVHEADCKFVAMDEPIHPNSTVGMLLSYVTERPHESFTFHITTPSGDIAVKEQGDGINVPA